MTVTLEKKPIITGPKLSPSLAKIALRLYRDLRDARDAVVAEYESDVRSWRTSPDGKRGLKFPYCMHGVSTWVDYDCACWRCEEYGFNGAEDNKDLREMAIFRAKQYNDKMKTLVDSIMAFQDMGIDSDLISPFLKGAMKNLADQAGFAK